MNHTLNKCTKINTSIQCQYIKLSFFTLFFFTLFYFIQFSYSDQLIFNHSTFSTLSNSIQNSYFSYAIISRLCEIPRLCDVFCLAKFYHSHAPELNAAFQSVITVIIYLLRRKQNSNDFIIIYWKLHCVTNYVCVCLAKAKNNTP